MIDLYHGTSTNALEDIKREGIIPGRKPGGIAFALKNRYALGFNDIRDKSRTESVYLTTNPWQAEDFANDYVTKVQGGEPAVIRVRLPAREFTRLSIDEAWAHEASERWGTGFRYHGTIKPNWIKR